MVQLRCQDRLFQIILDIGGNSMEPNKYSVCHYDLDNMQIMIL